MGTPSRTVGATKVHALTDGSGLFFRQLPDAFPGVAESTWDRAARLDPRAHAPDDRWLLHFRCFAIRLDDGRVILVDAGIGPASSPAASWAPVPGELPAQLAAAGIAPDEIDTVVLSHLHTDHVGWAVVRDDPMAPPRTYFANAHYLLQRAELAAIAAVNRGLSQALVEPIHSAGQLSVIDGESRLAAAVRVVATPGHTPGHQSVLVESGEDTLAITGDLLVHAVQLVDPEVAYALEMDPALARSSRLTLLRELARRRATLATAHLTEPFLTGWP